MATLESLDAEQSAIARRQRIADMLMQQSQEPLETNQMAGGYVVPVSPLAGVAKVAQALSGAYIGKKADAREKSLSDKRMEVAKQLYSGSSSPTLADYANSGIVSPEQMVMLGSAKMTTDAGHIDKMEERKFQTEAQAKQAEQNNAFRSNESQISRDQSYAQQEQMARLQSALRPEPQPRQDPLVQVMDENGRPIYLPSSQAVGRLPFNAQLAKTDEAKDSKTQGKETVSNAVANLHDLYNQLDQSGGITNPDKSGLNNISAGAGSSAAGQTLGRLFGTKNQSIRNEIAQARPLLLQQIMRASGMSAKQMDSNTELKLWLSTATDPTLDVKANKAALDNIDAMYGTHLNGNVPDNISVNISPNTNPEDRATLAADIELEKNIEHTAKTHGITPEEVRSLLKKGGK